MSRVDDLIAEHTPNGVEFRALGDIARFVRGNGMPKTDLVDEGVGAIHYGQIYTRYGVWATETISFVAPETAMKLAKAQPGDIIITNTSENVEDVGKAVAWLGSEPIVTGGHATVIQHDLDPKYLAYWFQSASFSVQKRALATGTKVIDVSARQLAKAQLPVPPLEVQREIAGILDKFTSLEAKLEAELEARKRQYAHYRSLNLTFDADTPRVPLGDVVEVRSGWGFPNAHQGAIDGEFPFYKVSDMNLLGNETVMSRANNYVSLEVARSLGVRPAPAGSIIFPKIGAAVATNKKRILSMPSAYDNNVMALIPRERVASRFLYHWMQTFNLSKLANDSGAVPSIRKSEVEQTVMPLPNMDDQIRIADLLDRFDIIVNDLSSGLPAEIAARRKQYAYYRDKLFSFEEAAA